MSGHAGICFQVQDSLQIHAQQKAQGAIETIYSGRDIVLIAVQSTK